MTLLRDDSSLEQSIGHLEQLYDYFRVAEKPPSEFRVGTEHEKFALYADSYQPVPYTGERGLGALFAELRARHGFEALFEGADIVGLIRDGTSISLEPGGQLELSGAPVLTLHDTCREFREHVALMKQASENFGIVWVGLGTQPLATVDSIPRMPRERHAHMRAHLASCGTLGLSMMYATCGVQANFDFCSEEDAGRKLRVANVISPIVTALYANSSISLGKPNGFESWRAHIWRNTDAARCGFSRFLFEPDYLERGAYAGYTEWALDVPVMFLVRDGRYVPQEGRTFRQLMASGEPLTVSDWNLPLTTLFPEVRLKRVIEVRGADAVPPDLVCALPAFWKGVFYGPGALAELESRLEHWSFEDVDRLHDDVSRLGLKARTPDGDVGAVARELVDVAAKGLDRIDARNRRGQNEVQFLDPLYGILEQGFSPARGLVERWDSAFQHRVELLIEFSRY